MLVRPKKLWMSNCNGFVLILVVMECLLDIGILVHWMTVRSFNPCCNGMLVRHISCQVFHLKKSVLILVVMECLLDRNLVVMN